MDEVEGVVNGTYDYTLLKGDTGPLVYVHCPDADLVPCMAPQTPAAHRTVPCADGPSPTPNPPNPPNPRSP